MLGEPLKGIDLLEQKLQKIFESEDIKDSDKISSIKDTLNRLARDYTREKKSRPICQDKKSCKKKKKKRKIAAVSRKKNRKK
jgi:hypothetical protein